jgi:hypothetical protein
VIVKLNRAGFFAELRHGGPGGPSLVQARQNAAHPDEQRILGYLRDGSMLVIAGVGLDDFFDSAKKGIAPLKILTDGEWLWPGDLAYYVREYHVALPAEFIEHMRKNGWRPPALSQQERAAVKAEVDAGG